MYKRIKGKKFGRETDQRKAFMRSLAANLILREKIKTTKVRAKETAKAVERLITVAKSNNLAAIRSLAAALPVDAAQKLIKDIGPRFAARNGGYTRVIKLGQRVKDGSQIAIVEFVQKAEKVVVAKGKAQKGKKGAVKVDKKPTKVEKEKSDKAPETSKVDK
jgi:large subunit ribosomal protein L17